MKTKNKPLGGTLTLKKLKKLYNQVKKYADDPNKIWVKKDLIILGNGALAIQVCTSLNKKRDIELATNRENPCGTVNGWKIDEKESKKLGQAMVKCSDDSKRKHYILYS